MSQYYRCKTCNLNIEVLTTVKTWDKNNHIKYITHEIESCPQCNGNIDEINKKKYNSGNINIWFRALRNNILLSLRFLNGKTG
jgi:uncharacterized protein with PIN domain